jgi:hypothetical protein
MGANAQTTVPTFTAGQVLTADQQNQSARTGVPVFADTTARDAAFGGAGEKTLAEGQLCYLEDANVVQYYDGAAWATVGPSTPGGLVYLTGAAFTTQTSVSLPTNTFTSTYRNYRMEFSLTAVTSDADITVRMRASGTDNTTSNYFAMWSGVNSAGTAASAVSNVASSFNFGESDSTFVPYSFAIDILQPQLAAATTILGSLVYYTKTTSQVNGLSGAAWFNGTTQFDSLSVISSVASSITGAYRVYAYADS